MAAADIDESESKGSSSRTGSIPSIRAGADSVQDFAASSASADRGLYASFLVESPVDEVGRDIWNYMLYTLKILAPGLEDQIKKITVQCDDKLRDFLTLPPDAQREFAVKIFEECPVGKELLGIVVDVTVNYQKWNTTPYLYACLLGRDMSLGSQHSLSFGVTMEMLLYMCVTMACEDTNLQSILSLIHI